MFIFQSISRNNSCVLTGGTAEATAVASEVIALCNKEMEQWGSDGALFAVHMLLPGVRVCVCVCFHMCDTHVIALEGGKSAYWVYATLGEACVIKGDFQKGLHYYKTAIGIA